MTHKWNFIFASKFIIKTTNEIRLRNANDMREAERERAVKRGLLFGK